MKRVIFTLLVVVFASGIFPATSESKEKIKIKLASLQPRGSALMKILEEMGQMFFVK
jgi:hypothetical protein